MISLVTGFTGCRLATLPDVRVVWMHRFLSLPLSKTLPLIVPRLLPLHRMLQQHAEGQAVQLPSSLSLSSEKLQEDGVYLAENGFEGYIYFAQQAPTQLVRLLLGEWPNGAFEQVVALQVVLQEEVGFCLQQPINLGNCFVTQACLCGGL